MVVKADTYNIKGEKAGTTELPERIFGVKWNPVLVKQVYEGERANARRPWAHTKGRGDVRGGGRKPWRQKHLGRARHGSTRSPIWKGGGVTHGPLKERDYSVKINKKMRRGALLSLLSRKFKDNELVMLDKLFVSKPKTKEMFIILKQLRESAKIYRLGAKGGRTLVSAPKDEGLKRATKNFPYASYIEPRNINIVSLLDNKYIIMDKESVKELEDVFEK